MSPNMFGGAGIAFALIGLWYCWLTIMHIRSGVYGARYVALLAIDYFIFSATFIALYLHPESIDPEKGKPYYAIIATNAIIWTFLEHKRKKSME